MFKTFFSTSLAVWFWLNLLCPVTAQTSTWQARDLPQILKSLIQNDFPELHNQNIQLHTFDAPDAFFQSSLNFATVFADKPDFWIGYNPRILALNCPRQAVEAILAHELAHTLDYVEGGPWGILGIGLQILFDESNRVYEHRSDLRAVFRGYGVGLIAYRHWIYAVILPQDLPKKQRTYYSPRELELLITAHQRAQAQGRVQELEAYWLQNVPLSAEEILTDIQKYLP